MVNPNPYPTKNTLSPSFQNQALVQPNPCPTQNTFPSSLRQQALFNPSLYLLQYGTAGPDQHHLLRAEDTGLHLRLNTFITSKINMGIFPI